MMRSKNVRAMPRLWRTVWGAEFVRTLPGSGREGQLVGLDVAALDHCHYAHDLKTFFAVVGKQPAEVRGR
jgi:hypothetical protein